MKFHELKPVEGSRQVRNRAGRGTSSGNEKITERGQKRQEARSDGSICLGLGGRQTPLLHRLLRRGFINVNHKNHAAINLDVLNRFEDRTKVIPVVPVEAGIVKNEKAGTKVLADEELNGKLTVEAAEFSEAAQETTEAADGPIEAA